MKWGVGPELPFHEGGKVGRSDATPIKFFSSDNKNVSITRKKLMGVASLLFTFPPSWNANSGPTPHFIALMHSALKKIRLFLTKTRLKSKQSKTDEPFFHIPKYIDEKIVIKNSDSDPKLIAWSDEQDNY